MGVKRTKGYILGCDLRKNNKNEEMTRVWTVKVDDPDSNFDGQVFDIESLNGNLTLFSGLKVVFLLHHYEDKATGKFQIKAIHVTTLGWDGT